MSVRGHELLRGALELRTAALTAEVVGASGVRGVRSARRFIDDEAIEVAAVAADGAVLLGGFRRGLRRKRGAAGEQRGGEEEGAEFHG